MKPHITTYTGRIVNPLELTPEDIDIRDIAHSLACINRFNGHIPVPVNVAQHSVYVANLCGGRQCELQALLHDATEAYLGDVTKWLKMSDAFAAYREAEQVAQDAIFTKFGCDLQMHPFVDDADKLMVRFEAHMSGMTIRHPDYPPPTDGEKARVNADRFWKPWTWEFAESMFLVRAWQLGAKPPNSATP